MSSIETRFLETLLESLAKYMSEDFNMTTETIIIKNVSSEVAELFRDIRRDERRQSAAIFEDAITDYWSSVYEDVSGVTVP